MELALTGTQQPRQRRCSVVRKLGVLGVVVTLASLFALLGYGLLHSAEGPALVEAIAAGEKPAAPRFALPLIWPPTPPPLFASRSGVVNLGRLRGHPVVLNFWASWCQACKQEAPLLALAARTNPRVIFLGVDVQDFTANARAFLRAYNVPYPAVHDPDGSTYTAYGLTGIPETYYLDAQGQIVAHTPGQVSPDLLQAGIRQAQR